MGTDPSSHRPGHAHLRSPCSFRKTQNGNAGSRAHARVRCQTRPSLLLGAEIYTLARNVRDPRSSHLHTWHVIVLITATRVLNAVVGVCVYLPWGVSVAHVPCTPAHVSVKSSFRLPHFNAGLPLTTEL